ncbi:hypothetical protein [Marinobacter sp.]|uniref:hypothetical protein n=1 Tax=Marinobacter sp. TaxID=50741 RepID=UPI003A8FDB96
MKLIKNIAIAGALSSSLLVVGCGGSSDSDSSGSQTNSQDISGTATAPAGAVAYYETQNAFELALNFFISPLAAAITGLQPIEGAAVELIRVDNNGDQVGDVLATTVTSITGDYTLRLPEGVNLAGNLVVRITGQNAKTLRAQVVEQDVDISPVSEFVLQKFINNGADLDQLVVTDVVKLAGRVEEFDVSLAGLANLDAAFAALESEIGDFVENEVATTGVPEGSAASIAGNYRSSAISFGLFDSEGSGIGTLANDVWMGQFTFSGNNGGNVTINQLSEESAYGQITGVTIDQANLYYESEVEPDINDTFPGTLSANGLLSVSGDFEEDIDGDFGFRYPPTVYNFSQVAESGLFFLLTNEASVRYSTVDTNGDGVKDAIDPAQKAGDEIFRNLEVFAKQPTAFANADLTGSFGRVAIESYIGNGFAEVSTGTNILTFNGNGTFTYGTETERSILMGSSASYTEFPPEPEETDLPIVISPNGDITAAGLDENDQPEAADGFINHTFDFMAFTDAEGNSGQDASLGQTLLLKLPAAAPDVSGNQYRMLLVAMQLSGSGELVLSSSKFNSYVNMSSSTAGTVDGTFFEVIKPNLGGDVSIETYTESGTNLTSSIGSDGATTLTVADSEGTTTMEGFFNDGATLGIFTLRYADTGSDPDELGMVILVKTNN